MAKGFINDSTLTNIADAIRAKLNSAGTMLPGEMAALIESIYPDVSKVTAAAGDVLSGKVFVNANGNAVTGTMTNRGAVSTTVAAGGTYTIPAGYHNGSGKVTSEASSGYQAITGTVTVSGSSSSSINVSHGLGKTPTYGCILLASEPANGTSYQLGTYKYGSTSAGVWATASSSRVYVYGTSGSATLSASTATFTAGKAKNGAQLYFAAGTYRYLIVG